MDGFPWEVLVLGAVLLGNRVLMPIGVKRPAVFWLIQAVDLACAVAAVWLAGLPGRAHFPVVGWMVAALLLFHLVQNFAMRTEAERKKEREAADREHLRILRGARDDEPPEEA